MATIDEHQAYLQQHILDLLCLAAIFGSALTAEEIHRYLTVPITQPPLLAALDNLVQHKCITRLGRYYALPRRRYANPHGQQATRQRLLRKSQRWSRVMALVPFVKAVVVINGVATGNVREGSGIDLLIITKPGRIYVSKFLLLSLLKITRQLKTTERKAGRLAIRIVISTQGVNFIKDIMRTPEPLLDYWLLWAEPVYGAALWRELLRRQTQLAARFPNYNWPGPHFAGYARGWRWLDWLNQAAYRRQLKRSAAQAANRRPEAFIRIRPDIVNLHAYDRSQQVADDYAKLRAKYTLNKERVAK